MNNEYIKPGVGVLQWPLELDLFLLECQIQPLILEVSDTIECDSGAATLEKHWGDLNLLDVLNLAEIVQVVVDAGLVQTRQHVQARRVVMVPVNAENREFDAQ